MTSELQAGVRGRHSVQGFGVLVKQDPFLDISGRARLISGRAQAGRSSRGFATRIGLLSRWSLRIRVCCYRELYLVIPGPRVLSLRPILLSLRPIRWVD